MDRLFETWMFMNYSRSLFETLMFMNWFIKKPLICFLNTNCSRIEHELNRINGTLMRQLMGINGENFLEHEMFRNWTNEWKTKTGKNPCAWCKRLWRAFDAVQAGKSRASSGFSACHIIPLSGCIHRKAINRNKPFPGRNRILSVNSSSAKPQRLSRSKAE